MFFDTKLEILDNANFTPVLPMMADVQPYRKSFSFEDGYILETTYRAFCPLEVFSTESVPPDPSAPRQSWFF